MRSMTGYGEAVIRKNKLSFKSEIRSVNHRFFNLKMNLPASLSGYESDIEELLKKYIRRGSINLVIRETRPVTPELNIQTGLLKSYHRQLGRLRKTLGLKDDISISTLISLPGVLEVSDKYTATVSRQRWLLIENLVKSTARNLMAMREREGRRLSTEIANIIARMSSLLSQIEKLAPEVQVRYAQGLKERLSAVLASADYPSAVSDKGALQPRIPGSNSLPLKLPEYSSIRQGVANEVALFAQRSDITEEIHRLKSHIKEFNRTMSANGEAGKKLDFITQEMLREVNTIGTKANDSRITYNVIALKSNVDKIKEQVQNIE